MPEAVLPAPFSWEARMGSVAKYFGEAFGKQRALDAVKAGGWKVGAGPGAAGAPGVHRGVQASP